MSVTKSRSSNPEPIQLCNLVSRILRGTGVRVLHMHGDGLPPIQLPCTLITGTKKDGWLVGEVTEAQVDLVWPKNGSATLQAASPDFIKRLREEARWVRSVYKGKTKVRNLRTIKPMLVSTHDLYQTVAFVFGGKAKKKKK